MREALAISSEEGLKELWQRHENMHHMLWDGLKSMGLKSFVENDSERLITVNTITVRHSHHGVIIMFLLWYNSVIIVLMIPQAISCLLSI